ncbi:hypothetical protein ACWGLF_29060 [Streptomyces puniciscabiei]
MAYRTPQALKDMAQACLRRRLAASDDPRCAGFRRLIEEAVRPDGPRFSADLDAHMARCPYCTAAFEDLRALRDAPRQTLADGLLPWRGASYLRTDVPEALAVPPAPRSPRRVLLASTALVVALAPLLVFALTPADDSTGRQPTAATPAPPPVTVTATVSVTPSPSPSPTPARAETGTTPSSAVPVRIPATATADTTP